MFVRLESQGRISLNHSSRAMNSIRPLRPERLMPCLQPAVAESHARGDPSHPTGSYLAKLLHLRPINSLLQQQSRHLQNFQLAVLLSEGS
jgi:hypothetical protein